MKSLEGPLDAPDGFSLSEEAGNGEERDEDPECRLESCFAYPWSLRNVKAESRFDREKFAVEAWLEDGTACRD